MEEPNDEIVADALLAMGVFEAKRIEDTQLRIRGEPDDLGSSVPRGFLTVATPSIAPPIPPDCSGRLELATWIAAPSNPLTARVMVNRVWQHLFGAGIVSTVNNFGANGDRPSHPELLDYLASDFMQQGWSVKHLIRKIMLSRTYRLSTREDDRGLAIDPDNRLLWRMNQRRLEAEAIRDAMLLAGGKLDLTPAEASVVARVGEGIVGQSIKVNQLTSTAGKRSVYVPIVRRPYLRFSRCSTFRSQALSLEPVT